MILPTVLFWVVTGLLIWLSEDVINGLIAFLIFLFAFMVALITYLMTR